MVKVRAFRTLENAIRRMGFNHVAGVDEVGRWTSDNRFELGRPGMPGLGGGGGAAAADGAAGGTRDVVVR